MQSELARTNELYTSGIVNVPQNTSAYLFFSCSSDLEELQAEQSFNAFDISFTVTKKRKNQIVMSNIVLDIDVQKEIIHANMPMREAKKLKRHVIHRYVFFELDTLEDLHLTTVLNIYAKYNLPVYYHRTMRGFHFLSVKPVNEELYHEIMNQLKPLNLACPHVTLRIKPNKWYGEKEIFMLGNTQMYHMHTDTLQLKKWIENQDYWHLHQHYLVVNYKQNGEAGNL